MGLNFLKKNNSEKRKTLADLMSNNPLMIIEKLLILVSGILFLIITFLELDFLVSTLLGSTITGLNFFWTRRLIPALFSEKHVRGRVLLFYLLKFGISILVLYYAIVWYSIPPVGVLIGISNLPIAIMLYLLIKLLFPQQN